MNISWRSRGPSQNDPPVIAGEWAALSHKDQQILVTGYSGSPKGFPHCDEVGHQLKTTIHEDGSQTVHCVRTTHAEQNAIVQAAKLGVPIAGGTVYSRMTPCAVCAKMIVNADIVRVVCEQRYHAGSESEEMFHQAGIKVDFFDTRSRSTNINDRGRKEVLGGRR